MGQGQGESWCLPGGWGRRSGGSASTRGGAGEGEEQILSPRNRLAERPEPLQGVFLDSSPFISASGIKKQLLSDYSSYRLRVPSSFPRKEASGGGWWFCASCLITSDLSSLFFWTVLFRTGQSNHLVAVGGVCVCLCVSACLPGGQQRAVGAHAQDCCLDSAHLVLTVG